MKEVKIVDFYKTYVEKTGNKHASARGVELGVIEQELSKLLNKGWQIQAGGGEYFGLGFVVLVRGR